MAAKISAENNFKTLLLEERPNLGGTTIYQKNDYFKIFLIATISSALGGLLGYFIGSTFLTYGSKEPYLNHCLVLNSCDNLDNVNNSEIETCF